MITVGIDLAAQPERTAACRVSWTMGSARVLALAASNVGDDQIVDLIMASDKAGLDVPLGWPDAFVDAITAHHASRPWPDADPRALRLRATDHRVRELTGRWPLSVSTDRIAIPALRAARVLSRLPFATDRDGSGRIVEVYPAAALTMWGCDPRRYKRAAGREARRRLVAAFRDRTSRWLRMRDADWERCAAADDAFDALVAALAVRAAALGSVDPCPPELGEAAAREGWIAVPARGSLDRLA